MQSRWQKSTMEKQLDFKGASQISNVIKIDFQMCT